MDIEIAGINKESIVDGPGIRYTIFTQGCPHKCKGCHNPGTHERYKGRIVSTEELSADILKSPHLKGVSFSGGEPFLQAPALYELGRAVRERGMDVVVFTGYTFEELNNSGNDDWKNLMSVTDMLIDGRFILEERDLRLKFRGSRNQRILDCHESLKQGKAVPYTE